MKIIGLLDGKWMATGLKPIEKYERFTIKGKKGRKWAEMIDKLLSDDVMHKDKLFEKFKN